MRRKNVRMAALMTGFALLLSSAYADRYGPYLQAGEQPPALKEMYAGVMDIGLPAETLTAAEAAAVRRATEQCSLLHCEEIMQGKNLLDRSGSKRKKDSEHAKLTIGKAKGVLEFAAENDMKVRAATVIQPEDTPEWFFNDEWTDSGSSRKTDRETMIRRLEHAVIDQIEQINGTYPGLVSEWEVIRGGTKQEADPYRRIIGDDYPAIALSAAREAAEKGQKLLWALTGAPDDSMLEAAKRLHARGLLDGVVLECSLNMAETEWKQFEKVLEGFAETEMEVHLTNLEIADTDRTAAGQIRLAARYKNIFAVAVRLGIRSISFPALQDEAGRKKGTPPRMISGKGGYTAAYFGALQDESIPLTNDEEGIRAAAEKLDLDTYLKKEEDPVTVYKKAENHNPVMVQRFGADPWAMVYQDRVYLYMTGDDPAVENGQKPKTNDYSNIVTLRVISSEDLVNWTDHGSIRAAGGNGAAKWASNSWAPCAAWKTIDGRDKFFLYFANSGGGIGVLTADSPTGPFTDPIGKALISRGTPTCASVTWLFDPAVLVDEDGSAYLYFGGGIPDGKAADPGTARMVKLGDDMISLDGDPIAFNPPWLFEDSGINRFGDTYVYSYCSNFNVPAAGSEQGFTGGEIVYMTSDSPLGPYTYAGRVLKNPGSFFGVGGNNHHCMFMFRGKWYITYHAATLDKAMGWNSGYRSTFVDALELNEEGLPAPTGGTYKGVAQLKPLDPYAAVPGATAVSMAGATTEPAYAEDRKAGSGRMTVISTTSGGWVAAAGADFGSTGASAVRLLVRSEVPARVEIIPDSADGTPAAVLEIPACEGDTEIHGKIPGSMSGLHDLYFRFSESGVSLLEWQFE